ncbi:MAG: BRO family protein [Bacillota bacterium]
MSNKIQLFQEKTIRSHWDADKEEWYFSVVDVVEVLAESTDPKQYIKKMRTRDAELNMKWGTICTPVEMIAKDGKKRKVQAMDTKGILRLIQSIPSKNAEPFKLWLAEVGSQRLDEMADPEKAILRGADYYRAKGYTEGWINQRLQGIEMRKKLTDEWQERGVTQEKDYAILTNEMMKAWSGMTVKEYKQLKDLKKQNLRDNMTDIELTLAQLAEVTTTAISKQVEPQNMDENQTVARRGGNVAKNARDNIEEELGKTIISPLNSSDKLALK